MSEDTKIVCPNGHSESFEKLLYISQTAAGFGNDIVDGSGKVIKKAIDPNITTHHYTCLTCGARVDVKYQYGKRLEQ